MNETDKAVLAPTELQNQLRRLKELRQVVRDAEAAAKELATEVLLNYDQPLYFYDDDEHVFAAKAETPEYLHVDLERLAHEVSEAVLDEVAPRKLNSTAFKHAVTSDRIPLKVIANSEIVWYEPGPTRLIFVHAR
jgi:hypothetical protein